MQDQGKRILLAVGLCLLVLLGWQALFPPPPPPPKTAKPNAITAPATSPVGVAAPPLAGSGADVPAGSNAGSGATGDAAGSGAGSGATGDAAGSGAGSGATGDAAGSGAGSGATGDAAGSGAGSGATGDASGTAAEKPSPGAAKAPVARGPEQIIALAFPNVEASFSSYGGRLSKWFLQDKKFLRDKTLNGHLVPQTEQAGAFWVNFANGAGTTSDVVLSPNAEWTGRQISPTEVEYEHTTDGLRIRKTYEVDPKLLTIRVAVSLEAVGKKPLQQTLAVSSFGISPPGAKNGRKVGDTKWKAACRRTGPGATKSYDALTKSAWNVPNVRWGGFRNTYLMAVIAPKPGDPVSCNAYVAAGQAGLMQVDLMYPGTVVRPGEPALVRELIAYMGPTEYDGLVAADAAAGYSPNPGMKEVVDFGWFGFIGKPLHWLMMTFFGFTGNWGIAIVLLTIVVKGATLYWTTKSVRSMKAMGAVAPKMKELQTKYGDNPQKLRVETMALYQQFGVNPFAGCLPILLQMPIWIGLYRMLSSSGELYLEPLISGWISDLSDTDPFHVLPILLLVTMLAQARLTPTTGQTGMQQKILMYGLPIGFGVAGFFFPAGLTLYIFTNTLLSAMHSIYMNKYDRKSQEQMSKIAAAIAGEGAPDKSDKAAPKASGESDAATGEAEGTGQGQGHGNKGSRGGRNKRRRR